MKHSMNTGWQLIHKPLRWDAGYAARVLADTEGWLDCDLPCDIHMPLIREGVIPEPLIAENFRECRWTEQRSWWFKKTFSLPEAMRGSGRITLTVGGIDCHADLFMNGTCLGRHESAFYPFEADVGECLLSGENTLLIRVTDGMESVTQEALGGIRHMISAEYKSRPLDRGDERRAMVRRPQYSAGWDWGPRLVTCGIMGGVTLTAHDTVSVTDVCVRTLSTDPARVQVTVESENIQPIATISATVLVEILDGDRLVADAAREVVLCSGVNYTDFTLEVPDAALWWPRGYGGQPLYTARATVTAPQASDSLKRTFGIRTVALSMTPLSGDERLFAFVVNGVRVFMKGADWIPADSIYGRVTDAKYETLIRDAAHAHFNMLRIWGGGLYEKDIFYSLCDELGIMVWQDFMFACSLYPDHEPAFRELCRREMEYQIRRLRSHACMALWSGNNENQQIFPRNWTQDRDSVSGGITLYNYMAPALVRQLSPWIPYWNSSPYGGAHAQDDAMGDKHHWHECMMNPDMEKRITPEEYDRVTSKFVSEYGYPGPCVAESIADYFGASPIDRQGSVWREHNNTFEKDTVVAGIEKHYRDAEGMSLGEYLLYASLCQGLMLGYSLEALRFKPDCSGGLFWMYNDTWGETGWTIVDYYLRRKPSYYFVKRAFEPVRLILRRQDEAVAVVAVNDTARDEAVSIEYGWMAWDGASRQTDSRGATLTARSRRLLWTFAPRYDAGGCVFARICGRDMAPALLRERPFRELP
ncbi:MAG: beta-mannosidase, partial [Clostridiales bacterium]|nr:beta-mannosidase [Clostridiales bacterium]